MARTLRAFSNHSLTFTGLAFICSSKFLYIAALSDAVLAVERLMLSSTIVKPLRTSGDTFRASIASRTMYMRLIIFCLGDIGLLLIPILLYWFRCLGQMSGEMRDYSSSPTDDAAAAFFMFTVRAFIMRL